MVAKIWCGPEEGNILTDCQRCGECCKYVAIRVLGPNGREIDEVTDNDFLEWVSARGLKYEKGWLIIPSVCPRLIYPPHLDGQKVKAICAVQSHKPVYCSTYPSSVTWLPGVCAYNNTIGGGGEVVV